MAFEDREGEYSYIYYCRLSGLPYVFGTHPLPTEWDNGDGTVTIDGEDYQWSPTLRIVGSSISISSKAEPKAGLGVSGNVELEFRLKGNAYPAALTTDVWLNLTNISAFRLNSNVAVLQENLPVSTATSLQAVVDTTSGFDSSSEALYAGLETLEYTAKTSTAFGTGIATTLLRGRYGSKVLFHDATLGGKVDGRGGTLITTHPIVHEGRILRLWFCTGRKVAGTFKPYGATPESDEDLELHKGPVTRYKPGSKRMTVKVSASGLEQLLRVEAGARLPTANAGTLYGDGESRIQVAEDANTCYFTFYDNSSADAVYNELTLQNSGGDLAAGLYDLSQLFNAIKYTIFEAGDTPFYVSTNDRTGSIGLTDNGTKVTFRVGISGISPAITDGELYLRLNASRADSFWRCLGFEGIVDVKGELYDAGGGAGTGVQFIFTADRGYPLFYLPANTVGRTIYYRPDPLVPFDDSPGWVDDDGNAVAMYLRINEEEIVKISSHSSSARTMVVAARAQLGSLLQEHYLEKEEDNQKQMQLRQGLAFPDTSAIRVILYLMLGGSGVDGYNDSDYDKGWRGSGAYIPSEFIDVSAFEKMDSELVPRQSLAWFDSFSLWSEIAQIIRLYQLFIFSARDSSGTLLLTIDRAIPPLESDVTASSYNYDDSTYSREPGVDQDISEGGVINRIEFQAGFNAATGEYNHAIEQDHAQSQATYGLRRTPTLQMRGILDRAEADRLSQDIANNVFALFAYPFAVVNLAMVKSSFWQQNINDVGSYTDAEALPMPNGTEEVEVVRGCTDVPARLYGFSHIYPATDVEEENVPRGQATLLIGGLDGGRVSRWAPSAKCTAVVSATLTLEANEFTPTSEDGDVNDFAADYGVLLYNPGTNNSEVRVIDSVNAGSNEITLTAAPTLTVPFAVDFVAYNNANIQTEQQKYAYLMEYAGQGLDLNGGGKHNPFRYL